MARFVIKAYQTINAPVAGGRGNTKRGEMMKALSVLMVLFIIGCTGAVVKDPGIKPPALSKKQEMVLKQIIEVGAAVGGAVIAGTFKDGLIYQVIK